MTIPQYTRKNTHAFDQGLAINVGLKAAIVYNHVRYWIDMNVRNQKSLKHGRVWMYETQEDMASFFGYLSEKEVRESLQLLYERGFLDRDRLADNPFDRTWWYAIPLEKGQENQISNSCYMELTHNGIEYKLIFGHPNDMLRDKNISWESKGYLSSLVNLPDEIEFSLHVIAELIHFGYLVEVVNENPGS